MKRFVIALAAMILSVSAYAQNSTGRGSYTPLTVGTTDVQVYVGGVEKSYLYLVNLSATATVCLKFGAPATIAGSTCQAGELIMPPNTSLLWQTGFVPDDDLHAIASAATTPMTLGVR